MQQQEGASGGAAAAGAAAAAGHVVSAAQEPASVLQLFFLPLEGVYAVPFTAAAAAASRKQQQKQQQGAVARSKRGEEGTASGSSQEAGALQGLPNGPAAATKGGIQQQPQQAASRALALQLQLQANPFDVSAWNALLMEGESEDLYERVLEIFPASAAYWTRYAEYLYRMQRIQDAYAVYNRCVLACPHTDLWISYLRFLYRVGSLPEFVATLAKAVEKVGCDHRSGVLWLELLALNIRVYNTLLLLRGNTQGLLCAPQRFQNSSTGKRSAEQVRTSTTIALGSSPLMGSSEEQRAFCLPLSAAADSPSLLQRVEDVNVLRQLFQQCLSTAVEGVDAVWAAYCAFERSVAGSSTSQLAAKLILETEPRYRHAKKVYPDLVRLAKNIDPLMAAVPLDEARGKKTAQQLQQVDAWLALLRYESGNPLRLTPTPLLRRLIQTYQRCLLTCSFIPAIWYGFFQLLLAHNHPHRAVEVLRRAIDRFLPDDELLQLVLADFLEDRRMHRAAEEVYRSALALQVLQLHGPASPLAAAAAAPPPPALGAAGEAALPPPAAAAVHAAAAAASRGLRNAGGPAAANGSATTATGRNGISALLLLRYLGFIRRTRGEATWREAFNEVAQLQGCPWQVYQKHAQAEWTLYRNEAAALWALALGWQQYRLHPRFLVAYVDVLLAIGKRVNAARELLYVSVCALQREMGRGSRMLWDKWICLERQFGDPLSLRRVLELRGRQRLRLPLEERSLIGKAEGGDSGAAAAALEALGAGWESSSSSNVEMQAEAAVLCNFRFGAEGKARAADPEAKKEEGAEEEEDEEEEARLTQAGAHATLAVRRRQFLAGGSLEEAAAFYCMDHLVPRSSLFGWGSSSTDEEQEEETATDEEEEEDEEDESGEGSGEEGGRTAATEEGRGKSLVFCPSLIAPLSRRRARRRHRVGRARATAAGTAGGSEEEEEARGDAVAGTAAEEGRRGATGRDEKAGGKGREKRRRRRGGAAGEATGERKWLRTRGAESELEDASVDEEEEEAGRERGGRETAGGKRAGVAAAAAGAAAGGRGGKGDAGEEGGGETAEAVVIVRPDVSAMAAFHPELADFYHPSAAAVVAPPHVTAAAATAAGGGAAEGLAAAAAATAQIRESVLDLSSRVLSPPKLLCDLVALLPRSRLSSFVDADVVDYVMATLQALQLPDVPVKKYKPLPVKELLLLRRSQLQCFHAMQQQQQLQLLQQQQLQQPTAAAVAAATCAAGTSAAAGTPAAPPVVAGSKQVVAARAGLAPSGGGRERQQHRMPLRPPPAAPAAVEDEAPGERTEIAAAAAEGVAGAAGARHTEARPALPSMRAQSMRRVLRPAAAGVAAAGAGREGGGGAAAAAPPGANVLMPPGYERAAAEAAGSGSSRRRRAVDAEALSDVSSGDEGGPSAAAATTSSSSFLHTATGMGGAVGGAADLTDAAAAGAAATWLSGAPAEITSFVASAAGGMGAPSFAGSAGGTAATRHHTYRVVAPYPVPQSAAAPPRKQLAVHAAAAGGADWRGGPLLDGSSSAAAYGGHLHLPAEQQLRVPPPGVWGAAAGAGGPPPLGEAPAGLALYEAGSAGGQMHLLPPGTQAGESHQQYLLPYPSDYLCGSAVVTRGGGVLLENSSAAGAHAAAAAAGGGGAAAAAGMPPPFHVLPGAEALTGHPHYLGAAAGAAGLWPAAAAVTWPSAGVALPPAAAAAGGLPGGAAGALPAAAPFGVQHHFYHPQLYPLHAPVAAALAGSPAGPELHPHSLWAAGRGAAAGLGLDPVADLAAAAAGGALLSGASVEPPRSTRRMKAARA